MELRRIACTASASRPAALLIHGRSFSTTLQRTNLSDRFPRPPLSNRDGQPPRPRPSNLADLFRAKETPPRSYQMDYNDNMPPLGLAESRLPKMGPTAGRSVLVQQDLRQAFTRLRSIITQNRVRNDFHSQRFHEPPSVKKKRLRSERHRRRFKEGFKRLVGVVIKMKKMGL